MSGERDPREQREGERERAKNRPDGEAVGSDTPLFGDAFLDHPSVLPALSSVSSPCTSFPSCVTGCHSLIHAFACLLSVSQTRI